MFLIVVGGHGRVVFQNGDKRSRKVLERKGHQCNFRFTVS